MQNRTEENNNLQDVKGTKQDRKSDSPKTLRDDWTEMSTKIHDVKHNKCFLCNQQASSDFAWAGGDITGGGAVVTRRDNPIRHGFLNPIQSKRRF